MGFGHRVYKNFDPRAKIIKKAAYDVFEVTGHSPLLDIALKLEEIALEDEYFIERKLYPNVDFYSGSDLPGAGLPGRDVHRAVRHPADVRLARPLGGAARSKARRSAAPASGTPAPTSGTTSPSTTADRQHLARLLHVVPGTTCNNLATV